MSDVVEPKEALGSRERTTTMAVRIIAMNRFDNRSCAERVLIEGCLQGSPGVRKVWSFPSAFGGPSRGVRQVALESNRVFGKLGRVMVCGVVLMALVVVGDAEARTWSSKSGKFTIEAEMVDFQGGMLRLKKSDGKELIVPLAKLSSADQRWVRSELRRRKSKPKPKAPRVEAPVVAASGDWHQWRGPRRDGVSTETGLLKTWPAEGPPKLWSVRGLGDGFSSVSISGDHIYTMGRKDGRTHLICVKRADGSPVWSAPVGGGDKPNCTPTVDPQSGLVFGLSHGGDLLCVKASDGSEVWRKNYKRDFGGRMMSQWGYSESPLVDGDALICTPGGDRAVMASLDKKTGKPIWGAAASGLGGAGYASPIISNGGGVKQYLTLTGKGLIGVAATTGKVLWNYKRIANGTANIPTPIVTGDFVFTSTGYNDGGSALLRLARQGRGVSFQEIYYKRSKELQNHHGGMVMLGKHIYMGHGHNNGLPVCVDPQTGKAAWGPVRGAGGNSAALVAADGHLYFRYENGIMALVEASPSGYKLKGKFRIASVNGKSWPHPVIADKKLYLRDQDELHCYNLAAE